VIRINNKLLGLSEKILIATTSADGEEALETCGVVGAVKWI
jgi:hypothetical protein